MKQSPTHHMLLLDLLPEHLAAELLAEWVDPEADLRAVAEAMSAFSAATAWMPPLRARRIWSQETITWMEAHGIRFVPPLDTEEFDPTTGFHRWFRGGVLHRDGDRPAVEIPVYGNGGIRFLGGGDRMAITIHSDYQAWFCHGNLHRDGDRPAVVCAEVQEWWRHGKRHREGGRPAIVLATGRVHFYRDGQRLENNAPVQGVHPFLRHW